MLRSAVDISIDYHCISELGCWYNQLEPKWSDHVSYYN
jgi:hypothetical protein